MRLLAKAALLVLLSLPTGAFAQDAPLVGGWTQIRSNAGSCPHCRVEIARTGEGIAVVANNGWAAQLRLPSENDMNIARGGGRWKAGGPSAFAGKFFRLEMVVEGSRLYLLMKGTEFSVSAVFERDRDSSI